MAVGKLVRGAFYVHLEATRSLAKDVQASIEIAVTIAGHPHWNVVRIEKDVFGLLEYEDFDAAAFPRLIASTRVELANGRHTRRDFSRSANPLILHRKEQLLMPNDPRVSRWAETTKLLEEKGVFKDNHTTGRERVWSEKLALVGLKAFGDKVMPL